MDIILTIVGVVLGWLTSHYYSKGSSKELRAEFDALSRALREQTRYLEAIAGRLQDKMPAVAAEIREAVATKKYVPRDEIGFHGGDPCPKCHDGQPVFDKWANGPFGLHNAWYRCPSCLHEFQSGEPFGA